MKRHGSNPPAPSGKRPSPPPNPPRTNPRNALILGIAPWPYQQPSHQAAIADAAWNAAVEYISDQTAMTDILRFKI